MKEFFLQVLKDYAKRFWLFFAILYAATAVYELFRQVILEGLSSRWILSDPRVLSSDVIAKEFFSNPLYLVIFAGMMVFSLWGFAALYFAFSGLSLVKSVSRGLENILHYAAFVVVGGIITLVGFLILTVPVLFLLDQFTNIPVFLGDNESLNYRLILPLSLLLGLPGIFLLVAFSIGPFILLLEKVGIFGSLRESYRRVLPAWWETAITLFLAFLISGIAYLILSRIIFSLKLAFIPDLSFRGESMLRVFLYSIPWVVAASFFDFVLYNIYLRISQELKSQPAEIEEPAKVEVAKKLTGPFASVRLTKIIALVTLVSFIAVFAIVPVPAQAGGGGGIFGSILGIFLGMFIVAICQPCAVFVAAVEPLFEVLTFVGFVGKPILGEMTCSGSYDPIFGTCTEKEQETQQVFTTAGAKFAKFTLGGIPSPEDFSKDPNASEKVTIEWVSVGQPGTINRVKVKEKGGTTTLCGTSNSCSAGNVTTVCSLPYEKDYVAEIIFASCWQLCKGKGCPKPICSGCGWDTVGAKKEFKTSSFPLPGVDIKADGKDGSVTFTPGKPIKLTWTSEYALSCSAADSWSGDKPVSGSETVVPATGNEVYTLNCKRGDKSGSDSVSSAPAVKTIKVFGNVSGSGGGGGGGLYISAFNVSEPLNPGDTLNVSWSVQGATYCEVDNGIGQVPTAGTAQITFLKALTLTLTCKDDAGHTVSASKAIAVRTIPSIKEIIPE